MDCNNLEHEVRRAVVNFGLRVSEGAEAAVRKEDVRSCVAEIITAIEKDRKIYGRSRV